MDILNIDPKVLLVQTGGFILLLIVFRLFLFAPILGVLDARRKEVDTQYSDAQSDREAAANLKTEYDKRLTSIEDEMRAKITEAVKDGQVMKDEILADSRAQADRILAKAHEEIARERDIAMGELRSKVVDLTVGAAGRLIEANLDTEKHRELISKVIDDLDGVLK